ncbi:MAG: hypothetical protein ACI8TV_001684, partial [Porticoccaceae bacterium]
MMLLLKARPLWEERNRMTEAPIHTDLGSAELIEFSLKRG